MIARTALPAAAGSARLPRQFEWSWRSTFALRYGGTTFALGMPEMDGFEVITRIRASSRPEIRDLPAVALTAFARSEDRTKALRTGFEMHLAKPVDPGELVASIATLVRRARSAK